MKEEKAAFQHAPTAAQIAAAAGPVAIDDSEADGEANGAADGDDIDEFVADVFDEDVNGPEDGAPAVPITYDDAAYANLKPSHAFLARMQNLPRPAFLSRRPTRAELRLVVEIEKKLGDDGIKKAKTLNHSGGGAYAKEFQRRWKIALDDMSAGRRPDVGAGLLTPASYTAFMERFGKWMKAKESYALIRSGDVGRLGLRGQMRDPVRGEPHMRQTADGERFEREPPAAGVAPRAVHSSPARARSALRAPAATRQAAPVPRKMLSRPLALLGSAGPFDPTASGYSGEVGPKKRARRCCAECGWPQCGLGHELDGGRRVGGKRDHASLAGRRATAWGPCQVVVSDWNPDMPSGKRAKALLARAGRESSQALL